MWSLGLLALLLGQIPTVLAQGAGDTRDRLNRIQSASGNQNYRGTVVFSSAGVMTSSRIQHFSNGRHRFERLDVLDGQVRHQFRHDELVHTVWPQTRVAVVEQRDPIVDFPALPAMDSQVLENYDLRVLGIDRVAGHEADVLMLKPRDGLRFAQRLWSEKGTGLLLRTDVLGTKDEVLERSAFTELTLGGHALPESILGPMHKLEGYRVVRRASERTQMDVEGWALVRQVPGFRLISCVRQSLDMALERGSALPVLHTVYSDGLTHVSLFVEPFDPQRHKPMRVSQGATHTLMNRQGDWWITVMGDVPMSTVQLFAAGLERR